MLNYDQIVVKFKYFSDKVDLKIKQNKVVKTYILNKFHRYRNMVLEHDDKIIAGFVPIKIDNIKSYTHLISKKGEVWSILNRKFLKQFCNDKGGLYFVRIHNSRYIHKLVINAFITNPDNIKHIGHIDGNKQNNDISNLRYEVNDYVFIYNLIKNIKKDKGISSNTLYLIDKLKSKLKLKFGNR